MKTILSSRRRHQLARVSIFLIIVALIAGMAGCDGGGGNGDGGSYTLIVDLTAGGIVTVNNMPIPGRAMFIYDPGTVVSLNATPSADYRFTRWIGDVNTIANTTATITTITMNGNYLITAYFEADFMVATSGTHTVGLRSDGTAVAVGLNDPEFVLGNVTGWLDVGNWTGITQVSAGVFRTVGLKSDSTVVVVGVNYSEMGLNVSGGDIGNWTGIVQVSAGLLHTVGLKSNGTVVAAGDNWIGQCDVGNWTNIIQVAAGGWHTVGVKSDGTVVAVGANATAMGLNVSGGDIGNWTGITQVSASLLHTVGVKSDGTVVAVGANYSEIGLNFTPCDVGNWTDIVQVAAGAFHTVGLKSDGTVVAVGLNDDGQCDVGNWTDIVQVAANGGGGNYSELGLPAWWPGGYTLGLESDGTVVAVGANTYGQCNVSSWDLL